MEIIDKVMGAIIVYAGIIIWSKILNRKINYKDYKFYVSLVGLSIVTILNYYFVNNFIKIIVISLFMVICCCYLFKIKLKDSVILIVLTQILFMISDGVIAIIFTFIFDLNSYNSNQIISTFLINLVASITAIVLYKILFIKKFYNFLLRKTTKLKESSIIFLSLLLIAFGNIFAMILYNKINFRYVIIINVIYILFSYILIIYIFNTKNNFNKVYDKYNTTLNSLKEYELMIDRYRVLNHENKNELLTIRNMVHKNNIKTINYIDTIINNRIKDNSKIMAQVNVIPSGGLRGLIYSKILYMQENNINYELNISKEVSTTKLLKLDDNLLLDICKIIGVYLDNSIQEVIELKEKNILINMYIELNNLNIEISNNFSGNIDLSMLEESGYTTKSSGHGYGLALSKNIIENNKKLSNEKRINKNYFTQILKIKM